MPYILALDQGTTSSRAIVFDQNANIVATGQREFQQIFPRPGWVEHDPNEIWATQIAVATEALGRAHLRPRDIAAIGITNQRETTVVWDRETGAPVYNAIVWQDRRTADYCDRLKQDGHEDFIRERTGLVIDAYFSGSKVAWILDNVPGARAKAEAGKLAFGTIDSWLVWQLTSDSTHITDVTNASRTMLFNINTLQWDEDLLKLLRVPASMLPQVRPSSEVYGRVSTSLGVADVPIAGIAGDQQAALFGQMCLSPGMAKNTYGTGCFLLQNTGNRPAVSRNRLLSTVAWQVGGKTSTRSKAACSSAARSCSGFAMGSASSRSRPTSSHWPRRCLTTVASTSCRRSRALVRRTGIHTPGERSWGSREGPRPDISRERLSRASRSRWPTCCPR